MEKVLDYDRIFYVMWTNTRKRVDYPTRRISFTVAFSSDIHRLYTLLKLKKLYKSDVKWIDHVKAVQQQLRRYEELRQNPF